MKRFYPILCVVLCVLLLIVAVAGPAGPAGAQGEQGVTGEAGQDGITPKLRINEETNMWEVSYDNGKTWESMGVKATSTGAQGETGEAGRNGVTPQLRINEKTNMWEVSYNSGKTWTSLGIKAGGLNGADGANGKDGITPQLRINDQTNMWEVSYDKGATWTSLGVKATGNNGQNGSVITIGQNGNWFIDGVDTGVSAKCSCEEKEEEFVPVLRFAVAGDVHLRDSGAYASRERLESIFTTAYRYADTHDSYDGLDGIFFTGDNADGGTGTQQEDFFACLADKTRQGTVNRAIMGNHEFYVAGHDNATQIAQGTQLFLEKSGYDSEDAHLEIGGYHFIFLSMDNYNKGQNKYFSDAKLAWLEDELDKAVADAPKQHIFVFQHEPAYGTMLASSGSSSDKNLRTLLNNYPQVVDFSGHTHANIADPRSVWQGEFTALTTGGMAYLSLANPSDSTYGDSGLKASDTEGGWVTGDVENGIRNGGMYYIVEVDDKGVVQILVYNIFTNDLYGEPIILDTINPNKFTYTNDRRDAAVKPEFMQGAALDVLSKNHKNVLVEIPQAVCKDVVQGYRVEAYQGSTLVKSIYRLSGSNYGDAAPEKVKAYISGLQPATDYTIKVYAISSYALESVPMVVDIKTNAVSATPEADIFNIRFNTNGTAINAATGEILDKYGAPTVAYDDALGMNVATFDGDDAYAYMGLPNWTSELSDGFTFETYAYVAQRPTGGNYWDILSAQQSGGFGFEYKPDQKVYAYCFIGSGWKAPAAAVPVGQWAHMTGVYDGSSVKIYINGVLAAETAATGAYRAASYLANFLCVGADAGNMVPQNYHRGKIATAKVYSEPLNATQIADLYADLVS